MRLDLSVDVFEKLFSRGSDSIPASTKSLRLRKIERVAATRPFLLAVNLQPTAAELADLTDKK